MSNSSENGSAGETPTARLGRTARRAVPTDRLPPHDEAAERGVLGCVLYSPEASAETLSALQEAGCEAKWFYDLRHQLIYAAMQGMAAKNIPIDLLTLQVRLKKDGNLEQCSGVEYLSLLQDAVPSAANLLTYLEPVRENYQRRQLLNVCTALVGQAYDFKGPVDELMAGVERDLLEVTAPAVKAREQHIKDVLPAIIDELENYHKGKTQLKGLPCGFDYLDKVLGGIHSECYWVVAGRPGTGKTTFAEDVIKYLATEYEWWKPGTNDGSAGETPAALCKGIPIGVFSLEMSNKALGRRLVFSQARVSYGKFKQGFISNRDTQALVSAMGPLSKANIYLDEEPKQTIGKIRAKAQRMARQYGIKLFVLDYLQLVQPDNRSGRTDRVQELADISSEIVYLKKKLGIPWMVLAQMNRNIETAERMRVPVMSDLKDCGCIEQDADIIQFLHKPSHKETEGDEQFIEQKFAGVEFSERPRRIDAVVAKNRDGATGIAKLLFHSNQFRFEDWRKWCVDHGFAEAAKGESYKRSELPSDEEMEGN